MQDSMLFLVVGHNLNAMGAANENHAWLNEYDINVIVKNYLEELLEDANIPFNSISGTYTIPQKISLINESSKSVKHRLMLELHFNAFNGYISNSSGAEVLAAKNKPESTVFADCLLKEFEAIGNRSRGILQIEKPARGWQILQNTNVNYACIAEPLFIDSEEGERLLDKNFIYDLAGMYFNGIYNFLERIK